MTEEPPDGSYLASRYYDPHRRREVRRVYMDDGRVEAFDGDEWWTVCTFSPDQVERAKQAIRESGLLRASDVRDPDAYDVAHLTYTWRLNGEAGSVTSWSYPVATVPAFEAVDERLDALEAEAGAEWSRL